MLEAVLLLAKGSRGYRLVFHHPPRTAHTGAVASIFGYDEPLLAELLSPKSALCGRPFELVIDDRAFVGHPTLLLSSSSSSSSTCSSAQAKAVASAPVANAAHKEERWTMEMFNIVFVLRRSSARASSTFHTIAEQLATAIKHEEMRCGFLGSEVALITRIHDDALSSSHDGRPSLQQSTFGTQQQQHNGGAGGMQPPAGATGGAPSSAVASSTAQADIDAVRAAVATETLERSALARHIRDVYDGLGADGAGVVHLRINGWVSLGLCAGAPVAPHVTRTHLTCSPWACPLAAPPVVRPYHTILLHEDQSDLLRRLPADASPLLRRVIQLANPLRSLQDLSLDSGITIAQLLAVISHLLHWRLATVINTISKTSLFVVSPCADLDTHSAMMAAFDATFKSRTLPTTLAEFSFPQQLGQHLAPLRPDDQLEMVQVVLWLLRRRLLLQLNTYALLLLPSATDTQSQQSSQQSSQSRVDDPHVKGDAPESKAEGKAEKSRRLSANGDVTVDPMAIASSVLPSHVLAQIMRTKAAMNKRDLALFLRLVPYLDGRHCMEEIMWRENLGRGDVIVALTAFREVVVTCVHE
eukprot:Opistho-2@82096